MTAKMVGRLSIICGMPNTPDAAAFFSEFAKIVGKWPDEVLDAATDAVLKARTYPGWPTPGECRKACEAEAERLAAGRVPEWPIEDGPQGPVDAAQAARVQALVDAFKRSVAEKTVAAKKPAPRDVSRPAFEEMQANSPNRGLHSWRGK